MKPLTGIVTAMLTPFSQEGALDIPALERLTDYLIDSGVDCLYPTGSMGEMLRLSTAERKTVVETVVRAAAGRVPVYAHVGAVTTQETVELAQHAQACGADGIGVVTPAYFTLSQRELEAFYLDVASCVDCPVYLYAIPQYAVNDISADLAARLNAKSANIVGIKTSVAESRRIMDYLAIGNFRVLQGQDRLTLPCLTLRGVDGIVSGGSSAYPDPYVAIRRALLKGDIAEANEANDLLQGYLACVSYGAVPAEKAFLKERGLDIGPPRRPGLPATEEQVKAIKNFIAEKITKKTI